MHSETLPHFQLATSHKQSLPSVFWHCWLGATKSSL